MHFVLLPCILLTLPAMYAVQGLRNGRVSVRPSVPSIDICLLPQHVRGQQIYRVGQNNGSQTHDHNSVILNRLKKFHWKIPWQICSYMVLIIPPYLAYVATLPCETSMSAKQAISNKLQGSVVERLRRGGVVNNQIKKKGLLMSLEFIIELGHRANWVSGSLDSGVTGSLGHKNG